MDYRSLTANMEVTVLIRDREVARNMAATFDADRRNCTRIDRRTWRLSPLRRTAGNLLRLLSPLL